MFVHINISFVITPLTMPPHLGKLYKQLIKQKINSYNNSSRYSLYTKEFVRENFKTVAIPRLMEGDARFLHFCSLVNVVSSYTRELLDSTTNKFKVAAVN